MNRSSNLKAFIKGLFRIKALLGLPLTVTIGQRRGMTHHLRELKVSAASKVVENWFEYQRRMGLDGADRFLDQNRLLRHEIGRCSSLLSNLETGEN